MRKVIYSVVALLAFVVLVTPTLAAKPTDVGFNEFGYNYHARIFNGTGESWSLQKGLSPDYLGAYANDKLVMKWNEAWDKCNTDRTPENCAGAWENNEWNGMGKDGSSSVWKYKIVWVGNYITDPTLIPDGGYGIWNEYAVLMDQGKDPSYGPGHFWFAHASPTGYGNY